MFARRNILAFLFFKFNLYILHFHYQQKSYSRPKEIILSLSSFYCFANLTYMHVFFVRRLIDLCCMWFSYICHAPFPILFRWSSKTADKIGNYVGHWSQITKQITHFKRSKEGCLRCALIFFTYMACM